MDSFFFSGGDDDCNIRVDLGKSLELLLRLVVLEAKEKMPDTAVKKQRNTSVALAFLLKKPAGKKAVFPMSGLVPFG